jgi:acetoacetyl-CoA synthetase
MATGRLLWTPSDSFQKNSQLQDYLNWLKENKGLDFSAYEQVWQWSVDQVADFWESLWEYFELISHSPHEEVLSSNEMPGASWFRGSSLNYAEHVFRMETSDHPAIIWKTEREGPNEVSWKELRSRVAGLQDFLKEQTVTKGDRVCAYLPNIPEATEAFLATCSLGAIWSSCSPDFGLNSVVDRFKQIEPKVLVAVDGYTYNGKPYDKLETVKALIDQLPTLEKVIFIPYLEAARKADELPKAILWKEALEGRGEAKLHFEPVPFEHPIWVLYSSGTTGIPKAITHSQGGVLMEHFKYLAFHNDVRPGERFFWFSTTGWMMWNFVQASLLRGATIVLYDGSPGYPDLNATWRLAEEAGIHHFGTSAPFLVACMKQGLQPGKDNDLCHLRSIGSTGSPLPPEAFDYVYENIKKDLWLCSMSGGTDVCTAFIGGNPLKPVHEGEIQCRTLGCALYAYNDDAEPVQEEVGEMVITKPMPSMPVFFWNDPDNARYRSSYFEMFPGIWRHGDWIKLTDRKSLIIYGRSDATLNRQGIRIGTSEIYQALNAVTEVADCLIVNLELSGGRHYMPLFVTCSEGNELTEELKDKIRKTLRSECSPRHVPDEIIGIPEIPYTISGKKMEAPVKKLLLGKPLGKAANKDSMRNPGSLQFFMDFAKKIG